MCSSNITAGIHSVTFQPTPGSTNEDRFVVEEWFIEGRTWKFLAVFDGHGGDYTAEYGAASLPERIEKELRKVLPECQNRSRKALIRRINELLFWRIYFLDREIGDAVQNLCPGPSLLDDEEAQVLVDANKDIFLRAFSGTTLAVALLDKEQDNFTHTPQEYCSIVMLATFAQFLGLTERGEWDEKLYFDDTTILVYDLTSTP
ncbi:uncharacterized protein ARMOST_17423 [Armillaria ostoyae]|uniref:PPM-type phosphatase domain-containing protein n=1 Tax=Armillaria ostoyae TaxID=47428 RepID=A0A284RYY5_ARMOS|nr:uncharacterized protein ARMOST_17423 [Armillaria ostoyae]